MSDKALYLTNCYALPDQVSAGPATRHFYHVQNLVQRGMTVHVITSDQSTVSSERVSFDTKLGNPFVQAVSIPAIDKDGILPRMTYHIRYFIKTFQKAWKTPVSQVVIASIPTVFVGWIGYFIARKNKALFFLDVRDLWSDSLSTTSLAKIPFFISFNRWLEKQLYLRADQICCTSKAQVKTVLSYTKSKKQVRFVPNGVDPELSENVEIHPCVQGIRANYRWIGLYAGKHSKYTDLDNLIEAAKELEKDSFALLLLGGGYTKASLQARVKKEDIKNVFFHDPVPKSEVAAFEAGADLFLINYSPEAAWAKVLPNKVFDYMFWNKPIIAAVVPGEISQVLHESKSGECVSPNNPSALVDAVREYLSSDNRDIHCREFLLDHFDRRKTVQDFGNMIFDNMQG